MKAACAVGCGSAVRSEPKGPIEFALTFPSPASDVLLPIVVNGILVPVFSRRLRDHLMMSVKESCVLGLL
jgi:hypothetical protein